MNYLLDTHTLLWFLEGDLLLPEKIKSEIKNIDNKCFISIASLWEVSIKLKLGKLNLKFPFEDLTALLFNNDIEIIPITFRHLVELTKLDLHHKDPFDRIIIAQGISARLTILTKDIAFSAYGKALIMWG